MKIKAIAILTAIILIVSYVPVYADTVIPDPPSDVLEYWVILEHSLCDFWCLTSTRPITVTNDEGQIIVDGYRYYTYGDNKWILSEQRPNKKYYYFDGVIYQANHDIAYEDGSGFFFLRPRVSPLYQGMKKTDYGTIWRTFSVGLIPVLGLLILAISLAKAWGFLRTQLKH